MINRVRAKKAGFLFFCGVVFILFLLFPAETVGGTAEGINHCVGRVIPSLFCFFVVADMMIKFGLPNPPKIACKALNRLFRLSGKGFLPIVLGLLSGFPIPATAVVQLYNQGDISKREGEILLSFTNNVSPSFAVMAVGYNVFGDLKIGLALYVIQILSAFLSGMIYCRVADDKYDAFKKDLSTKESAKSRGIAEIFTESVKNSAVNMLHVCAFVVFFSAIIKVISGVSLRANPVFTPFFSALCSLLELTTAIQNFSVWPSTLEFATLSGLMGFSGVCIICQIWAVIAKTDLSPKSLLIGKVLTSAISFILTFLFFNL